MIIIGSDDKVIIRAMQPNFDLSNNSAKGIASRLRNFFFSHFFLMTVDENDFEWLRILNAVTGFVAQK